MAQIALVADKVNVENGLLPLFQELLGRYDLSKVNFKALSDHPPQLVITNVANYLPEFVNRYPTIFILTSTDGNPFIGADLSQRRVLVNPIRQAHGVIVYSNFAAQEIQKLYRFQPIVQTPIISQVKGDNDRKIILYSGHMDIRIRQTFPQFSFEPYKTPSNFKQAILYVDKTNIYECANTRLCHAAANGVPCIARNVHSNLEMASSGDILLPADASTQKWLEAIKIALRDRQQNSQKNFRAASRFHNISDIERKIEEVVKNKNDINNDITNIKKASLPRIAAQLQQKRLEERINRLNKTKAKKGSQVRVKPVMGRRETLAERERRNRRAIAKQKSLPKDNQPPTYHILKTPSWFTNNQECDVSIIVPMYKSRSVIERQIKEWDLKNDGLRKEIIYVDDLCPQQSHNAILPTWDTRRSELNNQPVGKIITSDSNRGYGPNCNLGAKHALGKYLIFLNADVFVLENWVKPMYDLLENDSSIGIVGNMQIQTRGGKGLLDSAGSQWDWSGGHFEHIARTIYDGRRIGGPMTMEQLPDDLLKPGPREMVTGCCFMTPKKVFEEIGGYDEAYKIGYWEDADMNMAVTEKGYQIYFQPESKVLHLGGHTKAGGHAFMKQNRKRFYIRWVQSGFVDKVVAKARPANKGKPAYSDLKSAIGGEVIGCVIACNEEEFLEASVRSIAPMVDKFIFVIGGNQYAQMSGMCDSLGHPTDNTLSIAKSLAEEYGGEVIEPPGRLWKGKTEMRNAYASKLQPGQWMFMLDGDEVYKEGALWILADNMRRYECFHLQYYVFWNNMETIGIGQWENYSQERLVKWKQGYHYHAPNHLTVSDKDNRNVAYRVPTFHEKEKLFYHYSWVRPLEKIKQKLAYYENQLRYEWKNKNPVNKRYLEDVFLKWREDPESVKETHPRGGGETAPFGGIHPYGVTQLIQEGKLNF